MNYKYLMHYKYDCLRLDMRCIGSTHIHNFAIYRFEGLKISTLIDLGKVCKLRSLPHCSIRQATVHVITVETYTETCRRRRATIELQVKFTTSSSRNSCYRILLTRLIHFCKPCIDFAKSDSCLQAVASYRTNH